MSVLILFLLFLLRWVEAQPPHIVVILADDLGWNDVSFHGSDQIPTPNIDALAYNGIILNNHYVQPLCTPSRAAFMTGKYPLRIGMQHLVLLENEPRGLPIQEKLLPEYLKDAGYSTYAVGKWHLGFYRSEYTPKRRGFDYHYGYWNGLQDYFNHEVAATFDNKVRGYDMRRNERVEFDAKGKYTTTLLTEEASTLIAKHNSSKPMFLYMAHLAPHTGNSNDPLQAPDEIVAKFTHIKDPERRLYAAMVSSLDDSVGEVVSALRKKGILENSVILFMSDNGAPTYGVHANRGSNYPLRGQKESPWEGASRGVAAIWSPLFKNMNWVSNELIHISDWLPTFIDASGRDSNVLKDVDGLSMWKSLTEGTRSPRKDVVLNIDPISQYSALRMGDWKYVNGTTQNGKYDAWLGESGHNSENIYTAKDVLNSKASIALSAVITESQLNDKKNNLNRFRMKLLISEDVGRLRSQTVIKCAGMNEAFPCDPLKGPCLFNIKDDPCETVNMADFRPLQLETLENMLYKYQNISIPPSNVSPDERADPKYHSNIWISWRDDNVTIREVHKVPSEIVVLAIMILLILMYVILMGIGWRYCKEKFNGRCILCGCCTKKPEVRRRFNAKSTSIEIPTISVSQRVEMFEEKNHLRTLAS